MWKIRKYATANCPPTPKALIFCPSTVPFFNTDSWVCGVLPLKIYNGHQRAIYPHLNKNIGFTRKRPWWEQPGQLDSVQICTLRKEESLWTWDVGACGIPDCLEWALRPEVTLPHPGFPPVSGGGSLRMGILTPQLWLAANLLDPSASARLSPVIFS